MDALKNVHRELMDIFASYIETKMGFLILVQWLDAQFEAAKAKDPAILSSMPVQVGKGDLNLPSARYNYEKP